MSAPDRSAVAAALKEAARTQGFVLAGVAPAVTPTGVARLEEWIAAGYAGDMHYLADRLPAYADLNSLLDGARSVLMLAMPYRTADEPAFDGRIAQYAYGADYHKVLWKRLERLSETLRALVPNAKSRGVVDTAPLLEREFAQRAGLGWIGKNTLLLNREHGSWFFLAAFLTDYELPPDAPFTADHCGTCRACLEACPTNAFVQPYVLDATKCISYLTIENKNAIAPELREKLGDWFWGCDVCQEVCPWNAKSPLAADLTWQADPHATAYELTDLFTWTTEEFTARFRGTVFWRAKRRGLLRNAALILGNRAEPSARAALERGATDEDEIVADACRWALGKLPADETSSAGRG